MNDKIKTLIAAGTILTSIVISGVDIVELCDGQKIDYNDEQVCLSEIDYKTYRKEVINEYKAGEFFLDRSPLLEDVINIEIEKYKKVNKKDFTLYNVISDDNIIDLIIKELNL